MNSFDKINNIFTEDKKVVKASKLLDKGVSKNTIRYLCDKEYLKRVCRGYYAKGTDSFISVEEIIIACFPEAIITMESAIFHYDYDDYLPRYTSVVMKRNSSKK